MNTRAHALLSAVALSAAASARALGQTTVSIPAAADNTMYSELPNNSNGQGTSIFAGATSGSAVRRALVRFDLGVIPAHAPVASATLRLRLNKTVSGETDVTVHRALEAWGEGASNAGEPGGQGTAAATGDATWTKAFFNTVAWSVPGGVFVSAPSATTPVGVLGQYAWAGSQFTADVQYWVDTPGENFGWVVLGDEANFQTAKRFDSRSAAVPGFRPVLEVSYFCPADFNQDGFVTGDDFDQFVVLFEAGDQGADWDRNTFVTGDDFDGFIVAFIDGC